ncbi:flotillin-like FloA family protein [Crateriforma conspicua]|uniref:flotillin-like FloA family protein n=1 Tax=Crateriforma conspicua TaxID=2527996 RepID=UPI00118A7486|nr:flotillin-like FloA family protein [Crateriforma conspicua]QDV63771.1 SigmaW regulon antibacterial [Crateriforma conspicua]
MNNELIAIIVAAFLAVFILVVATVFLLLIRPWLQVFLSGGKASPLTILAMRLRGMPVKTICDAYVMIVHCGVAVDINQIQRAHLMGADVDKLARAVCFAKQNDEPFVWDDLVATAIEDNSRR